MGAWREEMNRRKNMHRDAAQAFETLFAWYDSKVQIAFMATAAVAPVLYYFMRDFGEARPQSHEDFSQYLQEFICHFPGTDEGNSFDAFEIISFLVSIPMACCIALAMGKPDRASTFPVFSYGVCLFVPFFMTPFLPALYNQMGCWGILLFGATLIVIYFLGRYSIILKESSIIRRKNAYQKENRKKLKRLKRGYKNQIDICMQGFDFPCDLRNSSNAAKRIYYINQNNKVLCKHIFIIALLIALSLSCIATCGPDLSAKQVLCYCGSSSITLLLILAIYPIFRYVISTSFVTLVESHLSPFWFRTSWILTHLFAMTLSLIPFAYTGTLAQFLWDQSDSLTMRKMAIGILILSFIAWLDHCSSKAVLHMTPSRHQDKEVKLFFSYKKLSSIVNK